MANRMIEVREDGVLLFMYDPKSRTVEISALLKKSRRREVVRIDLSAYDEKYLDGHLTKMD